jgi:hypothetical protein
LACRMILILILIRQSLYRRRRLGWSLLDGLVA